MDPSSIPKQVVVQRAKSTPSEYSVLDFDGYFLGDTQQSMSHNRTSLRADRQHNQPVYTRQQMTVPHYPMHHPGDSDPLNDMNSDYGRETDHWRPPHMFAPPSPSNSSANDGRGGGANSSAAGGSSGSNHRYFDNLYPPEMTHEGNASSNAAQTAMDMQQMSHLRLLHSRRHRSAALPEQSSRHSNRMGDMGGKPNVMLRRNGMGGQSHFMPHPQTHHSHSHLHVSHHSQQAPPHTSHHTARQPSPQQPQPSLQQQPSSQSQGLLRKIRGVDMFSSDNEPNAADNSPSADTGAATGATQATSGADSNLAMLQRQHSALVREGESMREQKRRCEGNLSQLMGQLRYQKAIRAHEHSGGGQMTQLAEVNHNIRGLEEQIQFHKDQLSVLGISLEQNRKVQHNVHIQFDLLRERQKMMSRDMSGGNSYDYWSSNHMAAATPYSSNDNNNAAIHANNSSSMIPDGQPQALMLRSQSAQFGENTGLNNSSNKQQQPPRFNRFNRHNYEAENRALYSLPERTPQHPQQPNMGSHKPHMFQHKKMHKMRSAPPEIVHSTLGLNNNADDATPMSGGGGGGGRVAPFTQNHNSSAPPKRNPPISRATTGQLQGLSKPAEAPVAAAVPEQLKSILNPEAQVKKNQEMFELVNQLHDNQQQTDTKIRELEDQLRKRELVNDLDFLDTIATLEFDNESQRGNCLNSLVEEEIQRVKALLQEAKEKRHRAAARNLQIETQIIEVGDEIAQLRDDLECEKHNNYLRTIAKHSRQPVYNDYPPENIVIQNLLRTQIEFYFSNYNLKRDKRLLDQLCSDRVGFLKIDTVMHLSRVRQLSSHRNQVINALKHSKCLTLTADNEWVGRPGFERPSEKPFPFRRTVFVFGLPLEGTDEYVRDMLSPFGKLSKVKFDHGPETLDRLVSQRMFCTAKVYKYWDKKKRNYSYRREKSVGGADEYRCKECDKMKRCDEGFYEAKDFLVLICLQCAAAQAEKQLEMYELKAGERGTERMKELLCGKPPRDPANTKTALAVFISQRQASKCVYVRGRIAYDGCFTTHYHHYSKLKKEIALDLKPWADRIRVIGKKKVLSELELTSHSKEKMKSYPPLYRLPPPMKNFGRRPIGRNNAVGNAVSGMASAPAKPIGVMGRTGLTSMSMPALNRGMGGMPTLKSSGTNEESDDKSDADSDDDSGDTSSGETDDDGDTDSDDSDSTETESSAKPSAAGDTSAAAATNKTAPQKDDVAKPRAKIQMAKPMFRKTFQGGVTAPVEGNEGIYICPPLHSRPSKTLLGEIDLQDSKQAPDDDETLSLEDNASDTISPAPIRITSAPPMDKTKSMDDVDVCVDDAEESENPATLHRQPRALKAKSLDVQTLIAMSPSKKLHSSLAPVVATPDDLTGDTEWYNLVTLDDDDHDHDTNPKIGDEKE